MQARSPRAPPDILAVFLQIKGCYDPGMDCDKKVEVVICEVGSGTYDFYL